MNRGFSIISILIIIGLIVLGYLSYNNYIKKDNQVVDINLLESTSGPGEQTKQPAVEIKEDVSTNLSPIKENVSVKKDSSPEVNKDNKIKEPLASEEEIPQVLPPVEDDRLPVSSGFYQNDTYNYQITYPPDWPLRVRSEDNISIGTVPPKEGQGAITIEVSKEGGNEINKAKAEAKKYPGVMSIKEEDIFLSGTTGTKLILSNSITNITNIYIILEKYGLNYVIKYTEESSNFVKQVKSALETFKFTPVK